MGKGIVISEALAQALLQLVKVGTFPFPYGQVRAVDDELTASIAASGVETVVASEDEVNEAIVSDFPAAVV